MEKPVNYRIHNIKIENKEDFMKRVLSLTYINESQLQKLMNIKTENKYFNQNMEIFFKLINFKAKFRDPGWYHEWLWEEYLDTVKLKKIEKSRKYGKRKWDDYIKEEEKFQSTYELIPKIEVTKRIKVENQEPYKRDNRRFNQREIDEGFQNEYINGRLASNMYLDAKEKRREWLKNS
jgi:hypothetical protein